MFMDVLFDLILHRRGRPWLGFWVKFGLEVLVRLLLMSWDPCSDASSKQVPCQEGTSHKSVSPCTINCKSMYN